MLWGCNGFENKYFVYVFVSILRTWRCRYTFHRRLVNYRGRVASCGDLVSPDTCTRCATSIYTVGTQLGTSHGWWALAGRGKRLLVIVICHLSPAIRPTTSAWEMANPRFGQRAAQRRGGVSLWIRRGKEANFSCSFFFTLTEAKKKRRTP